MASVRVAAAAKATKATKAVSKANTKAVSKKATTSKKRKSEDEGSEEPKAKKAKSETSKTATKKATPKKPDTRKTYPARKAEPKKSETRKPAPKKPAVKKTAKKDENSAMEDAPPPKAAATRPKKVSVANISHNTLVRKAGEEINSAPSQRMEVFVFGEGSSGELGMGSKRRDGKKPVDIKRPRYNDLIGAKDTGVVQIACGGMHVAALTSQGKMLTWGVNDDGALGRSTNWDGGLVDMDKAEESDSEDEDDTGVNPLESTPGEVSTADFIEGTKIVQVVACDSATFALTADGRVYGWGTFRASDGILGFSEKVKTQSTPLEITGLKNIKLLASGANHVMAVDAKGEVTAWGSGEQAQLGRRIGERYKMKALFPQHVGVPKNKKNPIVKMAAGSYHSFALTAEGQVYGWGLNNFGQVGVEMGAGEGDALVQGPTLIKSLSDYKIKDIAGGEHHSLACTEDGKLLVWGRIDGHQVGLPKDSFNEDNTVFDENDRPRILFKPTVIPDIPAIESVAAGTDTSFAVTTDGKVYTWGFSANYQTGLGTTDDIEIPTIIENSAIKEKRVLFAGAGGQYSLLCTLPTDESLVDRSNGTKINSISRDKTSEKDKENAPVSA